MEARRPMMLLAIAAAALASTGCATLFATPPNGISIVSEPRGAQVFVEGRRAGQAPLRLPLTPDKDYRIECRLEGHRPLQILLKGEIGVHWIVLDVLGGLIPAIVDYNTGAWYAFSPEEVTCAFRSGPALGAPADRPASDAPAARPGRQSPAKPASAH